MEGGFSKTVRTEKKVNFTIQDINSDRISMVVKPLDLYKYLRETVSNTRALVF